MTFEERSRRGGGENDPGKAGLSAAFAAATLLFFAGASAAQPQSQPAFPHGLRLLTGKELVDAIKGTSVAVNHDSRAPFR